MLGTVFKHRRQQMPVRLVIVDTSLSPGVPTREYIPAGDACVAMLRADTLGKASLQRWPHEDGELGKAVHADSFQRIRNRMIGESFGDAFVIDMLVKWQRPLQPRQNFFTLKAVKMGPEFGIAHRFVECVMSGQRAKIGKPGMTAIQDPDLGFLLGVHFTTHLDTDLDQIWHPAGKTVLKHPLDIVLAMN